MCHMKKSAKGQSTFSQPETRMVVQGWVQPSQCMTLGWCKTVGWLNPLICVLNVLLGYPMTSFMLVFAGVVT